MRAILKSTRLRGIDQPRSEKFCVAVENPVECWAVSRLRDLCVSIEMDRFHF